VRFATLEKFKANDLRLLVCSDVAARGLDISGLSHVFNFDVPHHAEDYVHRIGRTGRAGLAGHAFTIAMPEDRGAVEAIEKLIGHPIPPFNVEGLDPVDWAEDDGRRRRGRGRAPARSKAPTRERAPPRSKAARDKPVNDDAQPAPQPRPARSSRSEPRRDVEAPREAAPAREPAPRREPPPRHEPAPRREAPRHESRRRDEDLGPAVKGFGDDMPAFMLLRQRHAAKPAPEEGDTEA